MVSIPILAISGPTASGKSNLAIAIAVELVERGVSAEIVNADSMLVYRGMDIGTAKPSLEERRGIVHHLVDILDVHQTATVADFQRLAREAIDQIHSCGGIPILVGGSALYLRAILDNFEFPGTDSSIRGRLEAELDLIGPVEMHARLTAIAPDVAAEILPGNGRRTVRALEVIELTGGYRPKLPEWNYHLADVRQFGIGVERAVMDARISDRVHTMWKLGLVEEVAELAKVGLREGLTASRALGYRQVLSFLAGEITEEEAKEQTIIRTRQFARKQLGWFRRDPRITWLDFGAENQVEKVLASLGHVMRAEPDVKA